MNTMKEYKRYLVTSALPYANGPVHIGHLAGVYVPSDIYVRYLRARGRDVVWVCGSDEHGVPITLKARAEGVTPQDVVDKYHGMIKRAFEEFGVSFDIYSRTSSQTHRRVAGDFFRRMYEQGDFTEQTCNVFRLLLAHRLSWVRARTAGARGHTETSARRAERRSPQRTL